jgi:hypothetical protein
MAVTIDLSQAPWHLVDGVLRNKISGAQVTAPYWNGKVHNLRQVTQALTTKPKPNRMTIISSGTKFYIKSKDGALHSTRYPTKERAADAARRMAAGLIHFAPIIDQINKANLSNRT